MSKFVKGIVAAGTLAAASVMTGQAFAQSAPVVCPGYKKGKTNIPGERVGKKVQKAFEAYNEDLIDEAVAILMEIETRDAFDRAFTDRFLGNLLASMDGQGAKAAGYLESSVKEKVLNDSEHAGTLRLLGDLSIQEKKYTAAIDWYNKWMDFTCKEDPDVYVRMASAFYETKQLDKMIEPADKAIALYKKPNKNPYALKLTSYYERKMYKQTVEVAETLVKIFPENKQWWTQLAFFYVLVEDYKKALSTFEIAYNQGYLTKVSEIKTFAQMYATNDIPAKASEILERYIDSGLIERDEQNLSALANSLHQAKEHKKAAKYYGEAAKTSNDPDLYRKQGMLLLAAEDYKGAIKALQSALDRGSKDKGRIHMAMMEAHFYSGDFRQAYAQIKEAKKDSTVRRSANAWEPYIKEKAKNRGINI